MSLKRKFVDELDDRGNGNCLPNESKLWVIPELQPNTFAFLWTMMGVKTLVNGPVGGMRKSPNFFDTSGTPKHFHKWKLGVTTFVDSNGIKRLQPFLGRRKPPDEPSGSGPIVARFQLSIVDCNGRMVKTAFYGPHDFASQQLCRCDNTYLSPDILDPERGLMTYSEEDDSDDNLIFHCEILLDVDSPERPSSCSSSSFFSTPSSSSSSPSCSPSVGHAHEMKRFKSLVEKMETVMEDAKFSDITLRTRAQSFPALKSILAASSPVFRAMFSSENLESRTNTVEILDFQPEVVKAMLQFIYTGRADSLQENAMDLLRIAEKYELLDLKEDCERIIARSLSVENAPSLLVLAHLYSPNTLKPKIIAFINRFKAQVRKTESFKNVVGVHPALLLDLFMAL